MSIMMSLYCYHVDETMCSIGICTHYELEDYILYSHDNKRVYAYIPLGRLCIAMGQFIIPVLPVSSYTTQMHMTHSCDCAAE